MPFNPQQAFETYYLEIDPGTVFQGEPHKGNVYEYIFVTAGSLRISLGEQSYTINAGEFLRFLANCPHAYVSVGEEMMTAIMQISYLP